jgi:Rrf2 family protein
MRLGKASAYAVFAAVHVARHEKDGPVQGRIIADAYGIGPDYLLKILQQLVRSQVLVSEAGRRGGFKLKKKPEQITLLEIVEAIEGPVDGELTIRKEILGAEAAKDKVEQVCEDVAGIARSLLGKTTIKHLMV